jgi:hypothetical protein
VVETNTQRGNEMPTTDEVSSAINAIKSVADCIKELGQVPNGVLYSQLMGVMSLNQYNQIIGILERSGVIENRNNLLVWVVK